MSRSFLLQILLINFEAMKTGSDVFLDLFPMKLQGYPQSTIFCQAASTICRYNCTHLHPWVEKMHFCVPSPMVLRATNHKEECWMISINILLHKSYYLTPVDLLTQLVSGMMSYLP